MRSFSFLKKDYSVRKKFPMLWKQNNHKKEEKNCGFVSNSLTGFKAHLSEVLGMLYCQVIKYTRALTLASHLQTFLQDFSRAHCSVADL